MSIMVDLPPAMAQEAREYATVQGTTLERMVFDYLKTELERRRKADEMMAKFDALVEKSRGRLNGKPYKFNRADAASLTDLNDSVNIGKHGAMAALDNKSGIVMGFARNDDNTFSIVENKVCDVANLEKKVPDNFIAENGCDVTKEFIDYCLPLIMGEPEVVTENGIPKHISLK